jgi:hypothetical protein
MLYFTIATLSYNTRIMPYNYEITSVGYKALDFARIVYGSVNYGKWLPSEYQATDWGSVFDRLSEDTKSSPFRKSLID